MKRIILTICVVVSALLSANGEESRPASVYLSTDLTSAYLWRGQRIAGICLQPVMGLKWRGLDFFFWGNAQLTPPASENPPKHEIDIVLKYQFTDRFSAIVKDVYLTSRGNGFFDYGGLVASHGVELALSYSWFRYLTTEWSTEIVGADGVNHKGHRAYSSYLLATVPFRFCYMDWSAAVGAVPYFTTRYDDDSSGFHVNQVSLRGAYDFRISRTGLTALNLYSQLMVNPSTRKAYFQVGCRFSLFPAKTAKS